MVRRRPGEPDYRLAARATARTGAPGTGTAVAAAGVGLVLAPSVMEYSEPDAVVHDGVLGAVITVVAITGAAAPRAAAWASGATALLGLWGAVSPFTLDHGSTRPVVVNEVVVGAVVTVLSLTGVAVAVERSGARRAERARPSRCERRRGLSHRYVDEEVR